MLYLGSKSPRRRELLGHLTADFELLSCDVDEQVLADELPLDAVVRITRLKANAALARLQEGDWVITSDTMVYLNQQMFGKPTDYQDFERMMQTLAGQWHSVATAVCLTSLHQQYVTTVATDVKFTELERQRMVDYWASGEPQDKAGGYGIQGIGGQFIEQIKGSYSAVVGLPLHETRQLLVQGGLL